MNKTFYDLVVVGGGPAGVAAANAAASSELSVCLIDDNPTLGGQIWRGAEEDSKGKAAHWIGTLKQQKSVDVLRGMRVVDQPQSGTLIAEGATESRGIDFRKLVIATGARERFLPFPGWTLPNITGAGGLQALVKGGLDIRGKRVVVAGSGPLLIAVAAYLREHGAKVLRIAEQTSWPRLLEFGTAIPSQGSKLFEALTYVRKLVGVPFSPNCWPVAANGNGRLEEVTLQLGSRRIVMDCDYLACGFHLVPNTELAALLGCNLHNGLVQVDEFQQTTLPNVYCAGELTGIGGLELSIVEGEIAGYAAAGQHDKAEALFAARKKMRRFARALDAAFALRDELQSLAQPETIVCRCEDVTHAQLSSNTSSSSWREAKLHTRCGMGPCQGRVCGPATHFLYGWTPSSVRTPIFPTRTITLAHKGATE